MRKLRFVLVPVLGCLIYFTAPATPASADSPGEVVARVVNWVPNLILDTFDIVGVSLSFGQGYGLDVRGTRLIDIGCSDYDVKRFGLNGRNDDGGLSLVAEEYNEDKGITLLNMTFPDADLERDAYEVGATLHLFAGVEAKFNLRSALDLVTGFFFIDLEDDDVEFVGG